MANDASSKSAKISNSPEGTTLSNATDQQKVPPLRIVLNTSSNQKSSSTATAAVGPTQQTTNNSTATTAAKKERTTQDAKSDGTVKVGGRVRIKLGTNKQLAAGKQNNNNSTDTRQLINDSNNQKGKHNTATTVDKIVENLNEDSTSSFGHLRRITRRSQRAVQSLNNEDEESISSMTSTDENQNSNNNQLSSDIVTQDSEQSNSASATSNTANTAAASNATNGSNVETPRRYKRRKVESSESQSIDLDNLLQSQNYKLPNQNSFELFKNIRKQVDKRLRNLNNVHPRTPYGFRDYMLTRGAYLLDGNKLGNGTYLFMNEDGGLNPAPMGKYHLIRKDRTNYSVPNRAKVPLGLPVNSPLYDLFVEQEKERYRMRMQHIKEREKLTLSAEQEMMRVYNQAALTAADQTEPFSACTMLKHQEIYNYMDSDGVTILSREDAQQDQVKPDGVRTRRRQHGHISPSPTSRKGSDADDSSSAEAAKKDTENSSPPNGNHPGDAESQKSSEASEDSVNAKEGSSKEGREKITDGTNNAETKSSQKAESMKTEQSEEEKERPDASSPKDEDKKSKDAKQSDSKMDTSDSDKSETPKDLGTKSDSSESTDVKKTITLVDGSSKDNQDTQPAQVDSGTQQASTTEKSTSDTAEEQSSMGLGEDESQPSGESGLSITAEDKRVQNKELFLSHLQEIDDKWERIRQEMHIRHMNEAESLHAIQKLEWEWKTKEIGACDVRTTPVIDDTLVPRLNIYSQDY